VSGVVVRDLSVDYRGGYKAVHAVRKVSFEIAPGQMLGLVGESGSGKSTVAFALMGLAADARIMSGTARIGAQEYDLTVPGATAALRGRGMAMIFQDPLLSLNPVFTIGAHLKEVLQVCLPQGDRKLWREMAQDALAKVKLSDPKRRLDQYPHELSGGMRQRVVIAMALLSKPTLLIADEPTTALDVTVEAQVMREICELRDNIGCSVLLITHSLGLVNQYCDQLAVLYSGEILETGNVDDVAKNPGHPYTQRLLNCEVMLDQLRLQKVEDNRFNVIAGKLPDPRQVLPGCIFEPRCDVAFAECKTTRPPSYVVNSKPSHLAHCLKLRQK
jgi:peptide/nickel transport system ATP-binding protein